MFFIIIIINIIIIITLISFVIIIMFVTYKLGNFELQLRTPIRIISLVIFSANAC